MLRSVVTLILFTAAISSQTARRPSRRDTSHFQQDKRTLHCDLKTNRGCQSNEICKLFFSGGRLTHCACLKGNKYSKKLRRCEAIVVNRPKPTVMKTTTAVPTSGLVSDALCNAYACPIPGEVCRIGSFGGSECACEAGLERDPLTRKCVALGDLLSDEATSEAPETCHPSRFSNPCMEHEFCSPERRVCVCLRGYSRVGRDCVEQTEVTTNLPSSTESATTATVGNAGRDVTGTATGTATVGSILTEVDSLLGTTSAPATTEETQVNGAFLKDLNSLVKSIDEETTTRKKKPTVGLAKGTVALPSARSPVITTAPVIATTPTPSYVSPVLVSTDATTPSQSSTPSHGGMLPVKSTTALSSTVPLSTGTPPMKPLVVSAGNNRELYLPQDSIVLHANAWPPKSEDSYYQYTWSKISGPSGGTIANYYSSDVTLSELKSGTYEFKVVVRGKQHEYGISQVNVTVHQARRPNQPPKAQIAPNDGDLKVTLPIDSVLLDAKQSTDDAPGLTYLWEQTEGPLKDEANHALHSSEATLKLTNLKPGVYKFKLTVTDADEATDVAFARITVNPEVDYPPYANPGEPLIIKLPIDSATLYGNGSTDDKGIVSYLWEKSTESPSQGDLQGTTKSVLHLAHLGEGVYTFTLTVTDMAGQKASGKVSVVVKPENNFPPKVNAGPDKELVYPNDDSTTLDGRKTTDDMGGAQLKVHWEKLSGPETFKMSSPDEFVLHLSQLHLGEYVFKLTAVDAQGAEGSDTVTVRVKEDSNQKPKANAGPDVTVQWPNRAAALDGSQSSDDIKVVFFHWEKLKDSPFIGEIVNGSESSPVLRVYNLVPGDYTFKLTVTDGKGLTDSDTAKIHIIRGFKHKKDLIEIHLKTNPSTFSVLVLQSFRNVMGYELGMDSEDIIIEKVDGKEDDVYVQFYVLDHQDKSVLPPLPIAKRLQKKTSQSRQVYNFDVIHVDTVVCQETCSGHGKCNVTTKRCMCDSFWMENPFKANFGNKETNCDWSIIYVVVVSIVLGLILLVVVWACVCLVRSKRIKARRRRRYAILNEGDDEMMALSMLPKEKGHNGSLMVSESCTEEEETMFDASKKLISRKGQKGTSLVKNNKTKSLLKKK